jgi:hypothetical protein
MSILLSTIEARMTAALEYLQHETDPIVAITRAEKQIREGLSALLAARSSTPGRRSDDIQPLTFQAGERVKRSAWPPIEKGKA